MKKKKKEIDKPT